jgi:hypothetical protein
MVESDHTCAWTRRRETELTRGTDWIASVGIFGTALERAAESLGYRLQTAPMPDEDYSEVIHIGAWEGAVHDGCFARFSGDDPRLRRVLLLANLEVHAQYLGTRPPAGCLEKLDSRLRNGTTLRLRTQPHEQRLVAKFYRNDATWWERFRTPYEKVC